jgi:hypothetical protein
MNRVAPDQTTTIQQPCPWTTDEVCDELHGFCAAGTDPASVMTPLYP